MAGRKRWWRFWRDKGMYNDSLITVFINIGILAGGLMTLKFGKHWGNWMAFGAGALGSGLACVFVMVLLNTVFLGDDDPEDDGDKGAR